MNQESLPEIRRQNLELLVQRYGSMAKINSALGRRRNDSVLTQIKNRAITNRTGSRRQMGNRVARQLETVLLLGEGWMDRPHENADDIPLIDPSTPVDEKDTTNIPYLGGKLNSETRIPVTNMFLRFIAGNEHDIAGLRTFFISESTFPTIPFGSIMVVDTNCRSFTHNGVYLIRIGEQTSFRRINQNLDGTLRVWSDPETYEEVDDPAKINILGRGIYLWSGKTL